MILFWRKFANNFSVVAATLLSLCFPAGSPLPVPSSLPLPSSSLPLPLLLPSPLPPHDASSGLLRTSVYPSTRTTHMADGWCARTTCVPPRRWNVLVPKCTNPPLPTPPLLTDFIDPQEVQKPLWSFNSYPHLALLLMITLLVFLMFLVLLYLHTAPHLLPRTQRLCCRVNHTLLTGVVPQSTRRLTLLTRLTFPFTLLTLHTLK